MTFPARTAVALVGFNRPYYFLPTLRSLLTNPPISDCDLWIFLDGGPQNQQALQTEMVRQELARAAYAPGNVRLVLRPDSFGCGRNIIQARRQLFEQERYEWVFVFEDDMVISPHYLHVCKHLYAWAERHFSDVGVVQAYNACWLTPEQKAQRLDEVGVANSHWWGYLMPQSTWWAIRETLTQYENQFLRGRHYWQRDVAAIRSWFQRLLRTSDLQDEPSDHQTRSFPGQWNYRDYFQHQRACGQDAATALALALAGLKKIVPTVNRGLPIGRRGIHSTDEDFQRRRLDQIELQIFEQDRQLQSFRPRAQPSIALQPYMRGDEVAAIGRLLQEQRPHRVLEFGAGGSTVCFPQMAPVAAWWSLEHSERWRRRVLAALDETTAELVTLLACAQAELPQRLESLLNEVDFQLFFVDGFDRPQILAALQRYLSKRPGQVLLHDYARPAYAAAISGFSQRLRLTPPAGPHQGLMLLSMA